MIYRLGCQEICTWWPSIYRVYTSCNVLDDPQYTGCTLVVVFFFNVGDISEIVEKVLPILLAVLLRGITENNIFNLICEQLIIFVRIIVNLIFRKAFSIETFINFHQIYNFRSVHTFYTLQSLNNSYDLHQNHGMSLQSLTVETVRGLEILTLNILEFLGRGLCDFYISPSPTFYKWPQLREYKNIQRFCLTLLKTC